MKKLRILIIGDLHGETPKILMKKKDFDIIVAPGDFFGDCISFCYKIIMKNIDLDFRKICSYEKEKELTQKSLKMGEKVLNFLNNLEKKVFVVPGNWDQTGYCDGIIRKKEKNNWKPLVKKFKNIMDVEHTISKFEGVAFIGYGSTSAPEILSLKKGELVASKIEREKTILRYNFFKEVEKKLNKIFSKNKLPTIFISHNVPYNTKLDLVKNKDSWAHNQHYGSILARKLIEKYQPLLCIGGHIHEGFGKQKIGETICINSGFGGKVNTYVEIDIEKKKVLKVKFLGKNKKNK